MGERSETSRNANGISGDEQGMRGHLHEQERAEALTKSVVQLTLLVEFLEHKRTIKFDVYCETLLCLRRSIKNKKPGMLKKGVVLPHDNARPHVSRVTHVELPKFKSEQLDHPPWTYHPSIFMCLNP
ncbi:histone-lysine N-methyltransferase SETMAR [Trichonephila clavipes]|nr:histone-lysine N-methyltransferase SETMAR [Trichonephila clavipes]